MTSHDVQLPRVLIIDDLYGRALANRRNEERADLCAEFSLKDVTGDEGGGPKPQTVERPRAEAVFVRGQTPVTAAFGDIVEPDLAACLDAVRRGWTANAPGEPVWSLVFLDLAFHTGLVTAESDRRMPGMPEKRARDDDPRSYFGLTVLRALMREFPDLPVVMFSSMPKEDVSQDFTRAGAKGFCPKDSPEDFYKFLDRYGLVADDTGEIVGRSKSLLLALQQARITRDTDLGVLIVGELGVGKESFARYIHRLHRTRSARPLVAVASRNFTGEMWASELFGVKGRVATGVDARVGLIERAHLGDFFFDDIDNVPFFVQTGLLRVLQEGEIHPVGASGPQQVDVRFLFATNKDLGERVAAGEFAADFNARLHRGFEVRIPSLRDRLEDLPLLAEHFVAAARRAAPHALARTIEPDTLEKLRGYHWPGNVRELEACIITAVLRNPLSEHLSAIHIELPNPLSRPAPRPESGSHTRPSPAGGGRALDEVIEELENFTFDETQPELLVGRLPRLQRACALLLGRYLATGLKAASRRTERNPQGEIRFHPAMKFMTGNQSLTATMAASWLKRLLAFDDDTGRQLLRENPTLAEGYDSVLSSRKGGDIRNAGAAGSGPPGR